MKQSETNNETWRPVVGYEGLYEVSDMGNVRSLPRLGTHTTKPTLISPHLRCGYFHVTLWKNNRQKDFTVHRLVALAFIPNTDNLPCINHKDEVKQNNKAENLEWCTIKYNYNYSNISQRSKEVNGSRTIAYRGDEIVGEFLSMREAAKAFGISYSTVRNSVLGKKIHCSIKFKLKKWGKTA